MSWSFTVNDDDANEMRGITRVPEALAADFSRAHPMYPDDMQIALDAARRAYLRTFTCSGGRTISPYTGDEYVSITIMGSPDTERILESVKRTVLGGPDSTPTTGNDPILPEDDSRRRLHSNPATPRGIPSGGEGLSRGNKKGSRSDRRPPRPQPV